MATTTFSDTKGRQHEVRVTFAGVKRVLATLDIDLTQLYAKDSAVMQRLLTNPLLACDVVYLLLKPELDASGITDEQFGECVAGEAFGKMTDCLFEALAVFFSGQDEQAGATIRKALAAYQLTRRRVLERAQKEVEPESVAGKALAALEEHLAKSNGQLTS